MLPSTYGDFANKYGNLPFINIMSNSPIRVYYYMGEYHGFITTIEGIIPIKTKTAMCLARTMNDVLVGSPVIDLSFHYPNDTPQHKQKKIHSITGEYDFDPVNGHSKVLIKFLLLLI